MTGVGDDSHGRRPGRPWLVVGLLLAVGATLALVLSDDLRYLRLGIVAALWAALIGAFLAVRARKNAAHSEDAVAEAQAVYELELEREIAARREYELELETEAREAAQAQSREELDALRAEVAALRESLQSLFGGEVLLERVALTAQATRMRSLNDDQRLVSAGSESKNGNGKKPAQLLAPKKPTVDVPERPTEFMDRVLDAAPAERRRAPANGTAKTNGTSGANGSSSAGLNGSGPNGDRSTQLRTQQMPRLKPKRPEPPAEPEPFEDEVEADGPAPRGGRDSRANLAEAFVPRSEPGPHEGRASVADAFAAREPRNGAAESHGGRPVRGGAPEPKVAARGGAPKPRGERPPEPYEKPRGERVPEPYEAERRSAGDSGAHVVPEPFEQKSAAARNVTEPLPREAERVREARAPRAQKDAPRVDAQPTRTVAPVSQPEPPVKPVKPVAPVDSVKEERPVPRLAARPAPQRAEAVERTAVSAPVEPARHAEPASGEAGSEKEAAAEAPARAPSRLEQFSRSDLSPLAEDTPTGRHGAPGSDAVNPTLPEAVRSSVTSGTGGRRRRPEAAPAPSSGGRRRRPEGEPPAWEAPAEEAASGHHASGRSVTELLAANGKTDGSPRRRRRAED
ncbi:hypothetical protein CU254_36340 [Amycolatopsis sp. AA4]|uniref:DUF6779 domain-containing protein n=1 Tax=Actinomycetes TaxID=1760 RepID=UPI0001DEEA22|nr:hypothetical protein CU254_36340 [Amycolatopsis sp. AA4]EFL11493.1 predicted protein [Streptomyces sp. AA4]